MAKITMAFCWSMIMSVLAGLVVSPVVVWLDGYWWYGPAFFCGLVILQAWYQSREFLMKALGRRENPGVLVSNRQIPVSAGGLAAAFESIIPRSRDLSLEVDDSLSVMTATGLEISPERVEEFIRLAVTREYRGQPGLSRNYWTEERRPPWDRSEYEAMIYVLRSGGFIVGRRAGRAGKLIGDYRSIVTSLRRNG